MRNRITPVTFRYMLITGGFWMSFCLVSTYAAVYLQGIGYSNSEVGLIIALGNVGGALLSTGLGDLIDRRPRLKHVTVLNGLLLIQAVMLVLLRIRPQSGWLSSICYVIYMSALLAVNAVNLDICVRLEQAKMPLNFGVARSVGSLAFMVVSILLGILVEARSHLVLLYGGMLIAAFQFASNGIIARDLNYAEAHGAARGGEKGKESSSLIRFITENRRFSLMLLGVTIIFIAHNLDGSFLINEIRALGGDESTMGWMAAFQALVEVPVMVFSAWLTRKGTHAQLLRISFLFFVLKILAYALSPNIPVVFAARILQAPSYALYIVLVTPYASQVIPLKDSAKAQSLLVSVTNIGAVLAGLAGGVMFDRFDVRTTMLIAAGIAAVGAVIAYFGVEESAPERRIRAAAR